MQVKSKYRSATNTYFDNHKLRVRPIHQCNPYASIYSKSLQKLLAMLVSQKSLCGELLTVIVKEFNMVWHSLSFASFNAPYV